MSREIMGTVGAVVVIGLFFALRPAIKEVLFSPPTATVAKPSNPLVGVWVGPNMDRPDQYVNDVTLTLDADGTGSIVWSGVEAVRTISRWSFDNGRFVYTYTDSRDPSGYPPTTIRTRATVSDDGQRFRNVAEGIEEIYPTSWQQFVSEYHRVQ